LDRITLDVERVGHELHGTGFDRPYAQRNITRTPHNWNLVAVFGQFLLQVEPLIAAVEDRASGSVAPLGAASQEIRADAQACR
jgi:hypothetical protein